MQTGDLPDLAALREEYAAGGLEVDDVDPDPLAQFRVWMAEALDARLHEPNAMVLATVGADGRPSTRMVLLKGVDERGFRFFTNTDSRKGREVSVHPEVALLFPWHPLERQVRVEGPVRRLPRTEVAAYFASRPRGSQLGAWASPQSRTVADRAELAEAYEAAGERFAEGEVPLPDHWGGYVVRPMGVEFWQGRPGRMHDRIRYDRVGRAWRRSRLAP